METGTKLVLVAETPAVKQPKVEIGVPVVIGVTEELFYQRSLAAPIEGVAVTAMDTNGETALLVHVGVDGVLRTYSGVQAMGIVGFENVKLHKDGGLRVKRETL